MCYRIYCCLVPVVNITRLDYSKIADRSTRLSVNSNTNYQSAGENAHSDTLKSGKKDYISVLQYQSTIGKVDDQKQNSSQKSTFSAQSSPDKKKEIVNSPIQAQIVEYQANNEQDANNQMNTNVHTKVLKGWKYPEIYIDTIDTPHIEPADLPHIIRWADIIIKEVSKNKIKGNEIEQFLKDWK